MLNGLDIMLLLRLSIEPEPRVPAKQLAHALFLSPPEITQSLKRCQQSGLLYRSGHEKRLNRSGFLEFLLHGFRYVFPAQRGSMTRGIPTSIAAEPLKSLFQDSDSPPPVWPLVEGTAHGFSFTPLHRMAPRAALADPRLYELLALVDALRGDRIRERQLANQELTKRLPPNA